MTLLERLSVAIAVPAALFLVVIFISEAARMSLRDAASQRSVLLGAIAVLMFVAAGEYFLALREVQLLDGVVALTWLVSGFYVLYSLVVGITFLFRRKYRAIGIQIAVMCILALWWMGIVHANN